MSDLSQHIKRLQDKLQSLLKNYHTLLKENERLKAEVSQLKTKEENYRNHIDTISQKVNILQASAGQMNQTDQKEFEKRINQYIREIDKCIALLSE